MVSGKGEGVGLVGGGCEECMRGEEGMELGMESKSKWSATRDMHQVECTGIGKWKWRSRVEYTVVH